MLKLKAILLNTGDSQSTDVTDRTGEDRNCSISSILFAQCRPLSAMSKATLTFYLQPVPHKSEPGLKQGIIQQTFSWNQRSFD